MYFEKVFENQIDYFFLIVYDDFYIDNVRNSFKAAIHLK